MIEKLARVTGSIIGSAIVGWLFGNVWIGASCGAWITLCFWERGQNSSATKHDNHTCRDESPQLEKNAAVDPVTSENDGLGPNHVDARKET